MYDKSRDVVFPIEYNFNQFHNSLCEEIIDEDQLESYHSEFNDDFHAITNPLYCDEEEEDHGIPYYKSFEGGFQLFKNPLFDDETSSSDEGSLSCDEYM